MRVDVVTIFPEYFGVLDLSLVGRARTRGVLDLRVHDLRRWTDDVHRTVDDTPYGGGPGMVMRPEPWGRAFDELVPPGPTPLVVVPTPGGRVFDQRVAEDYAGRDWLLLACGRYEGIDARVMTDTRRRMNVDEVSVGDFVLAGGELAALVVLEAVSRLVPGVLGNPQSAADESFSAAEEPLLEGPVYTRPPVWRGLTVPPVLLSGDHAAIRRHRREEALRRTARVRPDLLGRPPSGAGGDEPPAAQEPPEQST